MRILFLDRSFPDARAKLSEHLPGDLVESCPPGASPEEAALGAEVIIPGMSRVGPTLMDLGVRLIQQFGAGLDGVDVPAARARGIAVANVPSGPTGNAAGVAELAVLHLLALSRRLDLARAALAEARWGQPVAPSLAGRTAAVIGLGAIGRELLPRLRPFGVRLIGVARRGAGELAPEVAVQLDAYHPVAELDLALAQSDLLVLCAPLTEATRGMIGAHELAVLAPGAILVNVARGPLVDREALLAALRSGRLAGAGLDVFWEEPVDPHDPLLRETVLGTPHIGGVTEGAYSATARAVAENVERLRSGEPLLNCVA